MGQYSQRPWWSYIYRFKSHTGLVQVVFNPEEKEIFEAAQAIRSEYVLEVCGIVKKRLDGTDNPEMSTGKIEIVAKDLTILNTSKTPPFKVNDETTNEDLRLQYRYIDLRSTYMPVSYTHLTLPTRDDV